MCTGISVLPLNLFFSQGSLSFYCYITEEMIKTTAMTTMEGAEDGSYSTLVYKENYQLH